MPLSWHLLAVLWNVLLSVSQSLRSCLGGRRSGAGALWEPVGGGVGGTLLFVPAGGDPLFGPLRKRHGPPHCAGVCGPLHKGTQLRGAEGTAPPKHRLREACICSAQSRLLLGGIVRACWLTGHQPKQKRRRKKRGGLADELLWARPRSRKQEPEGPKAAPSKEKHLPGQVRHSESHGRSRACRSG